MPNTFAIIFMGVSGSGKSTTAEEFAKFIRCPFAEADDFHSKANIAKMSAGIPLQDEDRWPWLRSIQEWISNESAQGHNVVLTCSALKRSYRELLGQANAKVRFVLLDVDRDELVKRMTSREDHYMPVSLLDSQLATLERLAPDEPGITLDANMPTQDIIANVSEFMDIETATSS
ncbi:Gluconokinase [Halomonadaceae bacterium LMG 33818]|uniref:gluconokinase n=1 Tax=Cernens ardua TaxID=3402176 RepID=UPI003EDC0806